MIRFDSFLVTMLVAFCVLTSCSKDDGDTIYQYTDNDKNYYMEEPIGNSGVILTRNPYFSSGLFKPFSPTSQKANLGQYFDNDSRFDP